MVHYSGKWGDYPVHVIERLVMGTRAEQIFVSNLIETRVNNLREDLRADHEDNANRFIVTRDECFGERLTSTLEELVQFHKDWGDSISWDLHSGNLMLRGDTPVITDPFYSHRQF